EEAQARLIEVVNDINKGDYIEPKKITFQLFAETWIKERLSIRGSTASAYDSIIKRHLVPHIGGLQIHEIRLDHVQALVAKLAANLSTKTLHNTFTLLRVMLVGKKGASAIKRGYIRHDPTRGLELPSRVNQSVQPPTPEQVWKLIDTAQELAADSRSAQIA